MVVSHRGDAQMVLDITRSLGRGEEVEGGRRVEGGGWREGGGTSNH